MYLTLTKVDTQSEFCQSLDTPQISCKTELKGKLVTVGCVWNVVKQTESEGEDENWVYLIDSKPEYNWT